MNEIPSAARDVIVALASPRGAAERAVVRLAGAGVGDLVRAIVADFARPARRGVHPAHLALPAVPHPIPVAIWWMPAPRSYTGDDGLEIHLPGLPLLVELLVEELLGRGARLAEAGEFTRRAYLSGRLDLAQAEAVARLVSAEARGERDAALELLAGGLSSRLAEIREAILAVLLPLELGLDFSEDVVEIPLPEGAREGLTAARRQLSRLHEGRRATPRSRALPLVVLVGPPNAGKSTLFNLLSESDAALVAPVKGTTRDAQEAELEIEERRCLLADTAGLSGADDVVGAASEARARARAAEADLLVVVRDGRSAEADLVPLLASLRPPEGGLGAEAEREVGNGGRVRCTTEGAHEGAHAGEDRWAGGRAMDAANASEDQDADDDTVNGACREPGEGAKAGGSGRVQEAAGDEMFLHVVTHADLLGGATAADRPLDRDPRSEVHASDPGILHVDARDPATRPRLLNAIAERLERREDGPVPVVGERQAAALREAAEALAAAEEGLDAGRDEELVAHDLRAALGALAALTGEEAATVLLDRVFSSFCIGK